MLAGLEQEHPRLKESLLSAMGNIKPQRLLDPRYLDVEAGDEIEQAAELLPIFGG
jgi:tRNA 2-thiocytidine biosynthesis protein TtcA